MTYALSVLIPARNETCYDIDLLAETVTNVLANSSDATELIVVLDGYMPTSLVQHPRITYLHHSKAIGQRAATNEAARVSRAKYVMKLDAHCALSKDFDTVLLDTMQPNWTVVPAQYNLVAFQWKCKMCGWLRDQGPKPDKCGQCKSKFIKQVKLWFPRDGRDNSNGAGGKRNAYLPSWRFDTNLEYQQWGALSHRYPDQQIHDTMSLLGACWMIERERYHKLNICDEKYGSWGQQGTEIACKSWLSGGELKVNTAAWFAHFFRVGGLHFPYPDGGRKERAMARCKEVWLNNKWEHQVHPLSWLIEKFQPTPDWIDGNPVWGKVKAAGAEFNKQQAPVVIAKPTKCALYYSCLSHDQTLELAARTNLQRATNGHELGVVTLNQRIDFGDWNVIVQREKSGTTMHYQILAGLERSRADYVFLCESDVLYHPSHFDFMPPDDETFFYNTNVWRVRWRDGHAVRTDDLQQVSGICASRKLLLTHYRKRIAMIEANGGVFDVKRMAYEPGTRGKFGDEKVANWESQYPNIDVTGHGNTLTKPKFSVDEFRNAKYAVGWRETDEVISGWPLLSNGGLRRLLEELANGQQIDIQRTG